MSIFLAKLGLSLLGGLNWLRGAVAAALRWIVSHPWQGACIALALLAFWFHHQDQTHIRQRDQARGTIAQMDAASESANRKYRATEARLTADARRIGKEKDHEIADIASARDALVEQLRSRPHRPASPAAETGTPAEATAVGTGQGLFAEDAEFLVGEAARADRIRAELKACYAQYDSAFDAMAGIDVNGQ